jgi:hypothetical protein
MSFLLKNMDKRVNCLAKDVVHAEEHGYSPWAYHCTFAWLTYNISNKIVQNMRSFSCNNSYLDFFYQTFACICQSFAKILNVGAHKLWLAACKHSTDSGRSTDQFSPKSHHLKSFVCTSCIKSFDQINQSIKNWIWSNQFLDQSWKTLKSHNLKSLVCKCSKNFDQINQSNTGFDQIRSIFGRIRKGSKPNFSLGIFGVLWNRFGAHLNCSICCSSTFKK